MPIIKLIAEFSPSITVPASEQEPFTYEILYPSSVVRDFFSENDHLPAHEFLIKALQAMRESNRRVVLKYGFTCFGCSYYEKELERMLTRKMMKDMDVIITQL